MNDFYLPQKILDYVAGEPFVMDDIGMSDSSVLIFDSMVLKITKDFGNELNEHIMMNWLVGKVPVPKIICYHTENGLNYLLMSKTEGKMSCDDEFMRDPNLLMGIIAEAMKALWKTDISDCPVKNDLSTVLLKAKYRVEHELVDIDDAEPETFGKDGFKDPVELLEWLYNNKPEEDFVLSHGDFCLPNIFIENKKFSGFVDIGRMGIAARYQDIALCYRSLKHNFAGTFNGISYGRFDEKLFFEKLGIEPDWEKIKYYILLDELF